MATHYSHILATVGPGNEFDSNKHPVSLDGFQVTWMDITGTPHELYLDPEPNQIVLRVEADEATLDAIAAAPGNTELFRDELPPEVV